MRRSPTNDAQASIRILALALLAILLGPALAHAQDDDSAMEIKGFGAVGYMPSFQDTDLAGSSLDDGHGISVSAGFSTGDMFTWLLGYQLSMDSNYNSHFFPVSMRMYDPWRILPFVSEDASLPFGLRVFTDAGLGLFFSQNSGKFSAENNARGAAWRLGGGVEIDITDDLAGYIDAGWTEGLGSANSYQYGTVGIGVVYRWEL